MSRGKLIVFLFLAFAMLGGTAAAQPERGTSELFVFAGGSVLELDDEADRSPLALDSSAPGLMFGGQDIFGPGMPFGPGGLFGGLEGLFGSPVLTGFPFLPNVVRERRSLGPSFLFGVQYGYYISDRAALEAVFSVAPAHEVRREFSFDCPDARLCAAFDLLDGRTFTAGESGIVAYHYGANLGFDLLDGNWRPMVLAGLGGVSFDGGDSSQTSFVFRFGGGIKGYFDRLGVRADLTDHLTVDHFLTGSTEHDLQVRGGLLVHWD